MDSHQLQRAHLALWKAWRQDGWPTLSEDKAYAAIMATGLDAQEAADVLKELERRGDVKVVWNRDLPFYGVLRDELGFPARKPGQAC